MPWLHMFAKSNTGHGGTHKSRKDITEWIQRVNWFNATFTLIVPLLALILAIMVPLRKETATLAILYNFNTALGITAGVCKDARNNAPQSAHDANQQKRYHRFWSHRSFRASFILKVYLMAFGAGAMQGSVRWWSEQHRIHHRYTDTDQDPYSIKKGLFYSHMGWILMKQDPKEKGHAEVADLDRDPVVIWQHQHYR